MVKTYAQFCPVAQALDLVGDRWTLLILRELSFGSRRFTDLRDALPGIAANLLTERLRELEADGLIGRGELPPPAARIVYTLTESGRDIRPVLSALARFGATRLPPVTFDTLISPRAAYVAGITAFFDPLAAGGVDEHFRFLIDGETFDIQVVDGHLRMPPAHSQPALTLTIDAKTLMGIRQDQTTLTAAIADARATFVGRKRSLKTLGRVFDMRA
jgi:DNA-binding HxlR family transcriptional regulator